MAGDGIDARRETNVSRAGSPAKAKGAIRDPCWQRPNLTWEHSLGLSTDARGQAMCLVSAHLRFPQAFLGFARRRLGRAHSCGAPLGFTAVVGEFVASERARSERPCSEPAVPCLRRANGIYWLLPRGTTFGGAMRRIGAALAIFLAVGAFTGFTGAAASAAPSTSPIKGTWGPAVAVPGLSALSPEDVEVVTSISCTGPADCTAGGAYQSTHDTGPSPDQAYVVSEVNGTWGNAEAVPGTVALNTGLGAATTAVSCSSPGNCVAVGYYTYRYAKTALGVAGFVANQVNGTWKKARPVPALTRAARFAKVTTVSCAPATTVAARKARLNCVAAGVSQLPLNTSAGFVLAEVHGTWGTAQPVPGLAITPPGSAVTSVSCPFPGTCGVGGYYTGKSRHSQAFVANEVNETWRKAQQVPGTATLNAGGDAGVTSLSCPVAGACVAAGVYKPKGGPDQIFMVSESAGQWKRAIQLPGSGKLVTHNGSTVGEASCASATTCEVGGKLYVVPDGTGSTITALSCPAPGYCAAGGQRINPPSPASFPASTIAIDEVAGRWSKTVSLHDGYIGAPDTESVYAISCAAPRSCGAGGNLGGGMGRPYAVVANETPVK